MQFLTLRDIEANASLTVVADSEARRPTRPTTGARSAHRGLGSAGILGWSWQSAVARPIHPLGRYRRTPRPPRPTPSDPGRRGDCFAPERKKPLPFLPGRVGLICGRNSDAEHDVVVNARDRWPATDFEIREVAVQGVNAVREVTQALQELDSRADIDVIVITRGGGASRIFCPSVTKLSFGR